MARIALLGNFRVSYTSESDYKWTLEKLGHTVFPLQETEATGEKVLETALKCGALFWVKTHGWNTPGMPMREVLAKLKEAGIPSFGYHLDLWLGIEREKDLKDNDYWNLEYFFSVDKEMADYLTANTQVKGYYLQAGVVEKHCFLGTKKAKHLHDVVFTGSYEYHKEHPYRKELIDFLHKTFSARFRRYGHPAVDQPNAYYIMGTALNDLYASTKVVVGDTLCPNFTKPYYFSNRSFEVTGKGGFLIHPYIVGLEDCFELGKEIVTYKYGDFEELKEKIDYYLTHPEEREEIRLAGHRRTKRFHTFTNRLQTMLAVIGAK
jgi:hypothetical protein